ncbi:MAG: helix-turn-helix domain-containing protein [Phycisphaerales bacterium JB039]
MSTSREEDRVVDEVRAARARLWQQAGGTARGLVELLSSASPTDGTAPVTTAEAAEAIGVTPRRLLRLAEARGIRPVGRSGSSRLWRVSDVRRLAREVR